MTAYITVSDADGWQLIAKLYVELHGLREGDKFATWHFLTWGQALAAGYEREFTRDGIKLNGVNHYIAYVTEHAEKDTRYPDAFALITR